MIRAAWRRVRAVASFSENVARSNPSQGSFCVTAQLVSTDDSQQDGLGFDPRFDLGSFCVEFLCSPRTCVGFPPQTTSMHIRLWPRPPLPRRSVISVEFAWLNKNKEVFEHTVKF